MSDFSLEPEKITSDIEAFFYWLDNLSKIHVEEFGKVLKLGGSIAKLALEMLREARDHELSSVAYKLQEMLTNMRKGMEETVREEGREEIAKKLLLAHVDLETGRFNESETSWSFKNSHHNQGRISSIF